MAIQTEAFFLRLGIFKIKHTEIMKLRICYTTHPTHMNVGALQI
jgi:hypothetical protein